MRPLASVMVSVTMSGNRGCDLMMHLIKGNNLMTTLNTVTTKNTEATMTHLQIAELTGSRNDTVKASMQRLKDRGVIQLTSMTGVNHKNQETNIFNVTERDSYIVVAQLYPEFTAKLVDYWMSNRNSQPKLPTTFREALLLAAEMEAEKERLVEQLQIAAPKVEAFDLFMDKGRNMTIGQTAKLIGFQRQKDFKARIKNKWLDRFGKALQIGIKAGYFEYKKTSYGETTYITPKGITYFTKLSHVKVPHLLTKAKQNELMLKDDF
ncbi:phage regulatory protein/antirepressor Ant [Photobacterium carnosum]|nr:phage regulatory protein/antirepressor Ant [Photobacterium carnosum]